MPRENSIGCIACACMHISLIFQLQLASKNVRSSGGYKIHIRGSEKTSEVHVYNGGGSYQAFFFIHFFPVEQTMSSGMGHRVK